MKAHLKRLYEVVIEEHLGAFRQMVFLVGPRQVGKTTTSIDASVSRKKHHYVNWDIQADRLLILQGPDAVFQGLRLDQLGQGKPVIVFDELHKYEKWKIFIKGFFDKYSQLVELIVTGSARLDVYKAGGDSLMGRYFLYRCHPLSVGELVRPVLRTTDIASEPLPIDPTAFDHLLEFGGFPEPFLQANRSFYNRWRRFRLSQLFQEDLRDLTRIQEISQIEILAELLRHQAGQLTSYSSFAKKINVTVDTIKRWLETLKSFYYAYSITPWTANVKRSLLKEPKYFLWDWSLIDDPGARRENFVASHLLKAVHFWTDSGLGTYDPHYLRDKEKREVDFLVSKDGKPWFLVDVKSSSSHGISKSLYYYKEMLQVEHAFQVVFDLGYVQQDCISGKIPVIVPATTFLSQLI